MMDAMDDLVTWLRGQLDEDERVARAVEDRSAPWDGQWKNDSDHALRTHNGWVLAHNGGKPYAPGLLDHIARHDPARVLREVEATRKILDLHAEPHECPVWDELIGGDPVTGYFGGDEPCPTLRLAALPYSGRDGYREEWRP